MVLTLQRTDQTDQSIIGEITVDRAHECWSLEPAHPIPAGTYKISLYESPHFHEQLPLLHDVPGHTFIEIHPGNSPTATHGCILVGVNKAKDWVGNSRIAFVNVLYKIRKAMNNKEEVRIEILDLVSPQQPG